MLFNNKQIKENSTSKIPNSAQTYPKATERRGVFILICKLPNGCETTISFRFPEKREIAGDFLPGYTLAIFNELMFANWYLLKLEADVKKDTSKADFPTDNLFIQEIPNQSHWDTIRTGLISDGIVNAVINPCFEEKTDTHNCIIWPFILDDYKDFDKLKGFFGKLPNNHTVLV